MEKCCKITKNIILVLLLVCTASIMTGCEVNRKKESTEVRIAHFPNITHAQALLGRNGDQFQKAVGEERRIVWKVFNAGPAVIEALFAGEIDIAYIGPVPAANGFIKSKGEMQIIAGAANAGGVLISKQHSDIQSIKDLRGKKVAVPQYGNTQDLLLRHMLRQNGLKESSRGGEVEVIQAQNADIKMLLASGNLDAAFVPEPWGTRLLYEVEANIVMDFDQVFRNGNYASVVLVTRTDFLKENEGIVEKIIQVHAELTDYINQYPEQAKKIVNNEIDVLTKKPLSQEVLDESFQRVIFVNDPEKESILELIEGFADAGFLREPPEVEGLFNLELLNKVINR